MDDPNERAMRSRGRQEEPKPRRPRTDVPGYEWLDAGAAASAGRGQAGRWPRAGSPPEPTRPMPTTDEPGGSGEPDSPGGSGSPDEPGGSGQPGSEGAGMGGGMDWSGESAREDEQMWRPSHDQPDPGRWHRRG